jgi:hypothetical protein
LPVCVTLIYTTDSTALSAAEVKSTNPAGAAIGTGIVAAGCSFTGSLLGAVLLTTAPVTALLPNTRRAAPNQFLVVCFIVVFRVLKVLMFMSSRV